MIQDDCIGVKIATPTPIHAKQACDYSIASYPGLIQIRAGYTLFLACTYNYTYNFFPSISQLLSSSLPARATTTEIVRKFTSSCTTLGA